MQKSNLASQFKQINQILDQNMKSKSLLVFGQSRVGKSTLMSHLCGKLFEVHVNDEGETILTGQITKTSSENLMIEFNIMKNTSSSGEEVSIIEMPSLTKLQSGQAIEQFLEKKILTCYIWDSVLYRCHQFISTIILPFDYTSDHQKIKKYFDFWEALVSHDAQFISQIRKSICFTFSKVSYEEDKNEFIVYLKDLSQNEEFSNNTYEDAVQNDRMNCFLAEETHEGQGQSLFNTIIENCEYFSHGKFTSDSYLDSIISFSFENSLTPDGEDWKSNLTLEEQLFHLQECFKVTISDESIFSRAIYYGEWLTKSFLNQFLKLDPKLQAATQNTLKQELNSILSKNIPSFTSLKSSFAKTQEQIVGIFSQIHSALFGDKQHSSISTFIEELAQIISKSIDASNIYSLPKIVERMALHIVKDNPNQNFYTAFIRDGAKTFKNELKKRYVAEVKRLKVFQQLTENPSLKNHPMFEEFIKVYCSEETVSNQFQEVIEEVETRIKRNFLTRDFYCERVKEIRASIPPADLKPPIQSNKTINQVKNLLIDIERSDDLQKRNKKLEDLFKKASDYSEYELALQCLMELGSEASFLSTLQLFFEEVSTLSYDIMNFKSQFILEKLIPFLEEKKNSPETQQTNPHQVSDYFIALKRSYDYISANFCETEEDYHQIRELSNQIVISTPPKIYHIIEGESGESLKKNQVKVKNNTETEPPTKNIQSSSKLPRSLTHAKKKTELQPLKYLDLSRKKQISEKFQEKEAKRIENHELWTILKKIKTSL